MQRDSAGIPIGLAKQIPNRSNWLAYLLERSRAHLEANGFNDVSDAIYKADVEWLNSHIRRDRNGRLD